MSRELAETEVEYGTVAIGDLPLDSGLVLPDVQIAYERTGPHGVPAILICHALTGNQFAVGSPDRPGWWSRLSGNGTTLGGIIVDGGRFDWNSPKFPGFTQPDPSYHNIVYAEAFGPQAFIVKARVQLLRDLGPALSPFNAFQLILGLETLHVRMKEHVANTRKIVQYLENHPAVEWVLYPEQPNHPSHALAKKYLPNGAGSVVVFGIKGGREAGARLIDHVRLWSHVANVGDAKSLIIHPASTTHSQLGPEDLKATGVTEDLIRLSVGIENVDDLIEDLEQAIEAATGVRSFNAAL